MAYGNVAQRRTVVGDRPAAIEWGERALALAEQLDDTEAYVYAITNIGGAEFQADRPEGRHKLERALQLAREHGLEEYAGRAYLQLVMCAQHNRRYDVAAASLDAGIAYCEERGLDSWRAYLQASHARQALDRGDWDDAAETAAAVLRDPRTPPVARGWALTVRGLVRTRRGDAEAAPPLAEAHELVRSSNELMRIAPVAAARAELAWLSGDDAAVAPLTDEALALAVERGSPWAAGELAYWRHQAGVRDEVIAAEPYRRAMAGDPQAWDAIGCPYEAALASAAADDEDEVRAAIEALQAMGARPAAQRISRRLRERGVRGVPRGPQPRTRENPAGLTARELEVLALVAEGMRNAQIARKLIVSEKTVNHHVSAVLRKLDVSTRGEASAKATRDGLV
jgi:DNA-binding CsgD family transcriptional regulator